ncbi:hypothetical protein [Streptosporangium sp. NPDC003464]
MNRYVELAAVWKVMVTGVGGGVGLVAIYALGLAELSAGLGRGGPGDRRPLPLLLAGVCFLIVVAGVGLGLYTLLAR